MPSAPYTVPAPAGAPAPALAPTAVEEEDTAIILYTSGTTGRPKGAMLTHLGICHSAMHYECCMGLTASDRAVVAVPMSHVTGVIALIAAMVRAAAALIVMPAFKARRIPGACRARAHDALADGAGDVQSLPARCRRFDAADYAAWRVGGYGGAPMAPATIARFAEKLPNLNLMNAYGATETTSPVTMMPPSETARAARQRRLRRALRRHPGDGRRRPRGAAGRARRALARRADGGEGLLGRSGRDARRTSSAGYWRSGDIGSKDAEGYVRVFDRKKDMINRGGYKIYSVEVENALMSFAGVVEAAVVAAALPGAGRARARLRRRRRRRRSLPT